MKSKGFTLIEVLVGTFLILIIFLGIFGAYQLGLRVVGLSKNKITATAIANEKIEQIRNLPYAEVGTIGASLPYSQGILDSATSTVRNNVEYTIETEVKYIVDEADGIGGQIANTGPTNPGTIVNDGSYGFLPWSSPGLAFTSDNQYAVATPAITITNYLKATNFGFSVPVGATINGVNVEIERKQETSPGGPLWRDVVVRLVKNGAVQGDDKADFETFWPTIDTYASYGGSNDLWGLALAPADVNASDFGIVLSAMPFYPGEGSATAFVDHIRITVYYTDSAAQDPCSWDYKRAEIKVSWLGQFGGEVKLVTDIAPKNKVEEVAACQAQPGGILSVSVFDAYGVMVSSPLIEVFNPQTEEIVDSNTPLDGSHDFPLIASTYKVVVSKGGYSTERTFGIGEIYNGKTIATPKKPHPIVLAGLVTPISFSIDTVSSFLVDTLSLSPFPSGTFTLQPGPEGKDAYVCINDPVGCETQNFGSSTQLLVGQLVGQEHIFIHLFDLGSKAIPIPIPDGSSIISAKLYLYFSALYPAESSISVSTHKVLADWQEDTLTWNNMPSRSDSYGSTTIDSTGWKEFDVTVLLSDWYQKGNNYGLSLQGAGGTGERAVSYSSDETDNPSLRPKLVVDYGEPELPNITFNLRGAKIIGTDLNESPIYKYSQNHTSNSQGHIDILNLEWDSYAFSIAPATGWDLVDTDPSPQPISLIPNANLSVKLYLDAENSLLVTVQNIETLEPIFSAAVRLFNSGLGYDTTQYTNEKGQTYFIPLAAATYEIEVQAQGYSSVSTQVLVSGDTTKLIKLEQIE